MVKGRIVKGVGGFYYVDTGDNIYESRAAGLFRLKEITPTVGDYVKIQIDEEKLAYVTEILPRKNLFIRPPVSNVDDVYIISSIAKPQTNNWLIDRMILLSRYNGMDPNIVINKIDLYPQKSHELIEDYRDSGFNVIGTSIEKKESTEVLAKKIDHKSSVFMGPSGVGKSSLINIIADLDLETGKVSSRTERGKHTTRHVEIYPYGKDSFIIDTPGFSSLDLGFISDTSELESLYYEFKNFGPCKFHNCLHVNEPGCAVKNAVEKQIIRKFRYENYLSFHEEVKSRRRY